MELSILHPGVSLKSRDQSEHVPHLRCDLNCVYYAFIISSKAPIFHVSVANMCRSRKAIYSQLGLLACQSLLRECPFLLCAARVSQVTRATTAKQSNMVCLGHICHVIG